MNQTQHFHFKFSLCFLPLEISHRFPTFSLVHFRDTLFSLSLFSFSFCFLLRNDASSHFSHSNVDPLIKSPHFPFPPCHPTFPMLSLPTPSLPSPAPLASSLPSDCLLAALPSDLLGEISSFLELKTTLVLASVPRHPQLPLALPFRSDLISTRSKLAP